MTDPLVISLEEARTTLLAGQISRGAFYAQAKAGTLPFVRRIGSRYLVSVPELRRWLGAEEGSDGPA